MIPREAPLYVRCYDLAHHVLGLCARFPKSQRFVLATRLQDASMDLLEDVTLALLQRRSRRQRLSRADESLVRLRLATRLSRELSLLSERQALRLHTDLDEIGRMLGGWQRRERSTPEAKNRLEVDGMAGTAASG